MTDPVLVVIDMQVVFGDPSSPWFTTGYPTVEPRIRRLIEAFDDRVIFTRFVAPAHPEGAWVDYYEQWPFALVPADDRLYDLTEGLGGEHRVVTETTFGKWGTTLEAALGGSQEVVLVGVSTDCCVISTALAAADAGIRVRVVEDACAGLSDGDHRRAIDAMALYAPLIDITSSDAVLGAIAGG